MLITPTGTVYTGTHKAHSSYAPLVSHIAEKVRIRAGSARTTTKKLVPNPLWQKSFAGIALLGEIVCIALKNSPEIYCLRDPRDLVTHPHPLRGVEKILAITATRTHIIAAVYPYGLIIVKLENSKTEENAQPIPLLQTYNPYTGAPGNRIYRLELPISATSEHPITLQYDPILDRAYMGVSLENTEQFVNTVYGIRIEDNKLFLDPIAPPLVPIPGLSTVNPDIPAQTEFLTTMHTSTGLSYLIVSDAAQNFYAYPITDLHGEAAATQTVTDSATQLELPIFKLISLHGVLADSGEFPKTKISAHGRVKQRTFINNLTSEKFRHDLFSPVYTIVGEQPPPCALQTPIINIFSCGDAVYIATENSVWSSQAIINERGAIAGWSSWVPVIKTPHNTKIEIAQIDPLLGLIIYIDSTGTFHRQQWQQIAPNISEFKTHEGVFSITEIAADYYALGLHQKIALLHANNNLSPIIITNKLLHASGAIHHIVKHNNLIFAAGPHSVHYTHYNPENPETLIDAPWENFITYEHIEKLALHNNYLYILHSNGLDRFPLDNLTKKEICYKRPVGATSIHDITFFDTLCILTTSDGLLYTTIDTGHWKQIVIPHSKDQVPFRAHAIYSHSLYDTGNLYILSVNAHSNSARVYRYYVNAENQNPVIPLPDLHEHIPSFWCDCGGYRTALYCTGASLVSISARNGTQGAGIYAMPTAKMHNTAYALLDSRNKKGILNTTHTLRGLIRLSSGALCTYGDTGVYVQV